MKPSLRHVHFVAIAGTGMGSLAGLMKARGIHVTGSDENLYPPMSTALEGWGIQPYDRFAAEHALAGPPDLVVIGNAVGPDNIEARTAIDEGLPYLSFPDALYEHAIAGKHSVVVSGTHGKTTTTSLVASILLATGREPSLLVGGYAHDFDGSFHEAGGEHFVVEGDEYDTAFFDKTPKFLHYGARTLVVTSVEFDHADIYRDLDHVKEAFRKVVAGLPADGALLAAVNHAGVRDVISQSPCGAVGYGLSEEGDPVWRAVDITPDVSGTRFRVLKDGEPSATITVPMHGDFNVENALAAFATAVSLGVEVDEAVAALAQFKGVKRRQELRGIERGVSVIDDFAHHPTAVRAAVGGLRARYPEQRLIGVFEPRTNTSRRAIFQRDYAQSFDGVDHLVVAIVPDAPIYSATGTVSELFSSEDLAADVRARGVEATALDGVTAIVDHLVDYCEPGDVVLVMSNGGFDDIWQKLLDALREAS